MRPGASSSARHPTVEVCNDEVAGIDRRGAGFLVDLERRGEVRAHAVVLAHGLRYDPPSLAGVDELWGRSVFHCAFCDGWEVRDLPLALHGRGPAAARSALVLANWSDDVVLCSDGPFAGDRATLASAGVRIREEPIRRLVGSAGHLERIEFEHGPSELRDALFVSTRRGQPNDLAGTLGCDLTDAGTIATDVDGRTSVSGVYAAGDAATAHSRSVANAIGTDRAPPTHSRSTASRHSRPSDAGVAGITGRRLGSCRERVACGPECVIPPGNPGTFSPAASGD